MKIQRAQKRRLSLQTQLRFENLEPRAMLAGNVKAAVIGAELHITGDSKANQIEIYQSGNQWKVKGLGTTVNGSSSTKSFSGIKHITTELRGGADFVRVANGNLPGVLQIIPSLVSGASKANDIVQVSKISATSIVVVTGAGADNVLIEQSQAADSIQAQTELGEFAANDVVSILNCTAGDNILAITGAGSDTVGMNNVTAPNLAVITHDLNFSADGNDTVSILNAKASDSLEIETGEGRDTVSVSKVTAGAFSLNLGTGNDVAAISNVTLRGSLTVIAGTGSDIVSLSRVNSADQISVSMDTGNDSLTIAQSTAETALLRGGDNADTLLLTLNTFDTLDQAEFESTIGA